MVFVVEVMVDRIVFDFDGFLVLIVNELGVMYFGNLIW